MLDAINPFNPNTPFFYLLKTSENRKVKKWVEKKCTGIKWINDKQFSYFLGWEYCSDCSFSGFCDYRRHKEEYLKILKADANYNEFEYESMRIHIMFFT